MAEFIPRTQDDLTTALLSYAASDPDIANALDLPTDLNVGSLERAHVEAFALVMEENDQRFAAGLLDCIQNSTLAAFGFGFLPAKNALGGEIFGRIVADATEITIPLGTQLLGPSGVVFKTTAVGTILANELLSAEVPITALLSGVSGNVPAGTIVTPISPIVGVDIMSNPAKTSGGDDIESSDARASRFSSYLKTLVRGTKEALEFAALSVAGVYDSRAVEPYLLKPDPPAGTPAAGIVWLYADDGTDNPTLSSGVYQGINDLVFGYIDDSGLPVPGYKAAGINVSIKKTARVPVYLRAKVGIKPSGVARWADIQDALTAASGEYFDRLRIGASVSYQNLVAYLTAADPDIAEVLLWMWADPDSVPPYDYPIDPDPISFYVSSSPDSAGARGILATGQISSSGPIYPEWLMGEPVV